MRTDGIKYGGQCSCGAQIIKAGDGEWHCPKCKKDDILARAEEYLAGYYSEHIMKRLLARARDLQSQIDALQTNDEVLGWNEDGAYLRYYPESRIWDIAQKWHTAYRKAQNSNLIRKQQLERAEARAKMIDSEAQEMHDAKEEAIGLLVEERKKALRWQEKAVEERARNLRDAEVSLYGNLSSAYIKDYYREARRELCISSTSSVTEKEAGDLPGSRPKEDYESVTTCINCGAKADQIRPDKDWYLGGIFLDPGSPGNECEPPEPAYGYFECRECRPMVLLTPERRAALEAMANLRTEIMCPKCGAWIGFDDIKPHMQVHRDMLEGKP